MIWFSSDLHLSHDKPFVYEPRGFTNIEDMNRTIIENFNSIVQPEDDLYLLGDLTLGPLDQSKNLLLDLPGKIHIILGNHDTRQRQAFYTQMPNVVEILGYAYTMKYGKRNLYLSHYPTYIDNYKEHPKVINLYGHTHQKDNFFQGFCNMYHVGVDSHNCFPVSIDEALSEIKSFKQG